MKKYVSLSNYILSIFGYRVTRIQYVKTVHMVVFCKTLPPLDTVPEDFCNRLEIRGLHFSA